MTTAHMRLSVILPCCNEAEHISACLESVNRALENIPGAEILVIDGMSDDGTRAIVAEIASRLPWVRLIDNPNRRTPFALNIGLDMARGDIVMRLDAHSIYPPTYIRSCLEALEKSGADNVGGMWIIRPRSEGLVGETIAGVLSHPLAVGNAHYRLNKATAPMWVDTVPYFCMKRSTLRRVGRFNVMLLRGQDMEYNLRLSKIGGRTLLLPEIHSVYRARSRVTEFVKHNWDNGVWAILPFAYSDVIPVSARHLAPLFAGFVGAIFGGLAVFHPSIRPAMAALLVAYTALCGMIAVDIARRKRDWRFMLSVPCAVFLLHAPYALGSLWGGVLAGTQTVGKRVFDVFISSFILVISFPMLLAVAAVIAFDSPGPVLFAGARVGLRGRNFRMWKFRTMILNAERLGGTSTADDDPRVTRAGRIMRRLKLDELPQLWNVLRGDMSLVGPRPQVLHDVDKYTEDERLTLSTRPGITDWASIRFRNEGKILAGRPDPDQAYIDLIRPEKIRLQMHYVQNRSFLNDLRILTATGLALIGREVELP